MESQYIYCDDLFDLINIRQINLIVWIAVAQNPAPTFNSLSFSSEILTTGFLQQHCFNLAGWARSWSLTRFLKNSPEHQDDDEFWFWRCFDASKLCESSPIIVYFLMKKSNEFFVSVCSVYARLLPCDLICSIAKVKAGSKHRAAVKQSFSQIIVKSMWRISFVASEVCSANKKKKNTEDFPHFSPIFSLRAHSLKLVVSLLI
jgi:hypothetical protein